jgi:SAM-dependent methyltransferase
MDPVAAQYEAYPYPERDPKEETRRLLTGTPSDPLEIDHFLYGGKRDWSQPFRALIAGGGTGDALVMLAQLLSDAGCPAEIVYLDLSKASREIAEARIAARGLSNVIFETGDLTGAASMGPFDYIDCCGVLHHLPDPQAGFDTLAAALTEGGGLGAMVYAPYGRTGVFPLQEALAALTDRLPPQEKVAAARDVLDRLPETNWFLKNALLGDHRQSDAGLYDLLLHARDRPFRADEVMASVERAGLSFISFVEPARYDPATWIGEAAAPAKDLPSAARAALAERLAGGIKTHVFYAAKGRPRTAAMKPDARPRLRGFNPRELAQTVSAGRKAFVTRDGARHRLALAPAAAPLLAMLDGTKTLGEVAAARKLDWFAFSAAFAPAARALSGWGMLHYSDTFK